VIANTDNDFAREELILDRMRARRVDGLILATARRNDPLLTEYQAEGVPLVVFAGKDYGMGSSRDWAAKGTLLLGVRAAIVESFERIHRSNLIGMGVLPLEFKNGMTRKSLKLDGTEIVDITGVEGGVTPGMDVACRITRANGSVEEIALTCRIDTLDEVEYYRHGGILQYVLRNIADQAA